MSNYTDEEKLKYRNIILNFVDKNKTEIAKIYQTHAEQDGAGMIVLDYVEQENGETNINVIFVKKEAIPENILEKINERSLQNHSNVIYMYMITPFEEQLIEMDFRDLI